MHRLHAGPKQERGPVPGPTLEGSAHLPWAHLYALSQDTTPGSFQVFIYSSLPKGVGFTRKSWHLWLSSIPMCWKDKLRRQMWGMEIVYWAPHWEMLQQKCYSCPPNWSHISSMFQYCNIMSLISRLPIADLLFLWSLSQLATGNLIFVDTWGQGTPASSHFPVGK